MTISYYQQSSHGNKQLSQIIPYELQLQTYKFLIITINIVIDIDIVPNRYSSLCISITIHYQKSSHSHPFPTLSIPQVLVSIAERLEHLGQIGEVWGCQVITTIYRTRFFIYFCTFLFSIDGVWIYDMYVYVYVYIYMYISIQYPFFGLANDL